MMQKGDLVTDGGSKYTRPTGDGYAGVYTVSNETAEVNLVSVGLERGDTVHVLLDLVGTVRLCPTSPDTADPALTRVVNTDGFLTIGTDDLNHLGASEGDDLRLYERDDEFHVVRAADDPKIMTDGGVERLHYASARSGKHRALHVDEDCPDLKQASETNSAPIMNLPRGSLCQRCGADYTLEELRARVAKDGGQELPRACPSCGYASTSGSTAFWQRTPRGRPTCPECGVIPDGHELRTRQEVPADD
jgi:hypothetical protein